MDHRDQKPQLLVPFHLTPEAMHRKGMRLIEENRFADGLGYLAKAYERCPDHVLFSLDYAQVLHMAQRYEESNKVLLLLDHYAQRQVPETYYGLACNFYKMQSDMAAHYCNLYLQYLPDGDYAAEAMEMMDALEEAQQNPPTKSQMLAVRMAEQGAECMARGEIRQAVHLLERALLLDATLIPAKCNLAQALFAMGETAAAFVHMDEILKTQPQNVFARCNMVLFLLQLEQHEKAQAFIETLYQDASSMQEDEKMVCVAVLGRANRHREAWEIIKTSKELQGLDVRTLHLAAACAYNAGEFKPAAKLWQRLCRVDPTDLVAPYFRNLADRRLQGDAEPETVGYAFELPVWEAMARMQEILDDIENGKLLSTFSESQETRARVYWGLGQESLACKRGIIKLLAKMNDVRAKYALYALLISRNQNEDLKREVLMQMKETSISQPFLAYMGGEYVELSAHRMTTSADHYRAGLDLAMQCARRDMGIQGERTAEEIYLSFIRGHGWPLPFLRKPENLAAGLYMATVIQLGRFHLRQVVIEGQNQDAAQWLTRCLKYIKAEVHPNAD